MNGPKELRALTSARGIAAWMVVLFHLRLSIAGLPDPVMRVIAKGYLAVDFFFLLSGFVIWLAWHERLPGGGWRKTARFWQKRVARVWPLHLVVLGGAVALALVLAASGRHDAIRFPFAELPLHVLLVQNWGLTDRLAWNDPAWSISCELAAYLLFPLMVRLVDWRRVPSWLVASAGIACLVLLAVAMAGQPSLGHDIPRFGLARCLAEFAAGTAVGALWLRWRDKPERAVGAFAVAGAMLAGWAMGAPEQLAVPIAFAALLLGLALTAGMRGNPLEHRWLHYLGEISYATYLIHFLLFYVVKLAFVDDPGAIPAVLVALYLALVLGGSVALHHLIERPAQRWVNALTAPRRRRALRPS